MMQVGDRKQGINKCWPNHECIVTYTDTIQQKWSIHTLACIPQVHALT